MRGFSRTAGFLVVVFLLSASLAYGEGSRSLHVDWELVPYFNNPDGRSAVEAFSSRRYESCADQFDALSRDAHPPEVELPATYMAAVCTLYSGRYKEALSRFTELQKTYPLLKHYHAFFKGKAQHRLDNPKAAIASFTSIPLTDANGERAFRNAIGTALSAGNASQAHGLLTQYRRVHAPSSELLGQVAKGLLKEGQRTDAKSLANELQVRWPSSQAEREVLAALSEVKGKRKKQSVSLSLTKAQQWKRAERLFSKHRSEAAASLFQALSKKEKKGSSAWCDAVHKVARSYDKLRKRDRSAPWHEKAVAHCATSAAYHHILYFSGKSAFQRGANSLALQRFGKLHTLFPKVSYNDDAWLWEARIHRDTGNQKQRTTALQTALREMPNGDMREQIEWMLIWDSLQEKKWKNAIAQIDASLAKRPRAENRYAEGRRLYWKGRALERLNRLSEAQAIFAAMQEVYPLSYYALLGFSRLKKTAGTDAAEAVIQIARIKSTFGLQFPSTAPMNLPRAADVPALNRGMELLRIGLPSPAIREFRSTHFGSESGQAWFLAERLYEAEEFHAGYQKTRALRKDYAGYFPEGSARKRWELAYPQPFQKWVTSYSQQAGIPPAFAYAIMRTESAFKVDAESWANAIGLLQLLVPTARDLVRGEESKPTARSLKTPKENIRLGTRFLGELAARFQHIPLSAAGYNAGPGALNRWVRQRGHLPFDEFVEEIPFREARRYVKSVTSALGAYHYLAAGSVLDVPLSIPKTK